MEAGLSFLGSYSECIESEGPSYSGQYCLANVNFPPPAIATLQKTLSVSSKYLTHMKLGLCVPNTCSIDEISLIVNKVSQQLITNSSVSFSTCYYKDNINIWKNSSSIAALCSFGLIFILVITGTIMDQLLLKDEDRKSSSQPELMLLENGIKKCQDNSKNKPFFVQLLIAFSLKTNGNKLFETKTDNSSITALHGIKFLSMLWIILGHSYSFALEWIYFKNPEKVKEAPQSLISQILANGTFSVDSFFFISGFLVSYLTLQELKIRKGKLNLFSYYLHRYLRMTPSMLALIVFSTNLLQYLGEGPSWLESITMFNSWCKKNWWLTILYLHNFIDTPNMCLSHTWYSAVDMQFYLISPIILILLHKRANIGIGIIITMLLTSMFITGYLTISRHYPAVPYFNDIVPQAVVDEYYGSVYIKPYCRIGPYLVGIALAYLINSSEGDIRMRKTYSIIGWITSIFVSFGVLFAMIPAINGNAPSDNIAALYSATSRTIWALSLAWIVFASMAGHGWLFNWFLSWKMWIPLSRLTYCAYLIHPIVIAAFYGSRTNSFQYSNYLMIYFTIGHLVITYALSILVSLFFESPFISLEKLFSGRRTKLR